MIVHMNGCSYVKILTIYNIEKMKKSRKIDRQDLQFLAILQAKKPCISHDLHDRQRNRKINKKNYKFE